MSRLSRPLAVLLLLALAAAGSRAQAIGDGLRPRVLAVLPPQADLVRRIAGPLADVESLVPEGVFPHLFEPTPHQLVRLEGVRIVVASGLPFEERLLGRLEALADEDVLVVPAPEGSPPHFWVDPAAALEQARRVAAVLARIDPAHRSGYEEGLERLAATIASLERRIARRLAPCRGGVVVTMHGALAPFLERFGLRQIAIEPDGKEPGPRRLAQVIEAARAAGAQVVLVEPQAGRRSAEAVAAALGARVVLADPLSGDYVRGLSALGEAVAVACGAGGGR